jgi:hypothetical protein
LAKKKKRNRIANPESHKETRISAIEPPNYDQQPPIFSLARVQPGFYCFSRLDKECKAQFAESIFKRRSITWAQLKSLDRHGLGFETISVSAIKPSMPKFITQDQQDLIAFRYNGMKPMVGYRARDVFYVLWFDHNFTLYNHA